MSTSTYTYELSDEEFAALKLLLAFGMDRLQSLVDLIASPEESDGQDDEAGQDTDEAEEVSNEDHVDDSEFTMDIHELMEKVAPYGIDRPRIYRRVNNGQLPSPRKINGKFYWHPEDVALWIKEHEGEQVNTTDEEEAK